jgi:hypothetical protein
MLLTALRSASMEPTVVQATHRYQTAEIECIEAKIGQLEYASH